MRIRVPVDLLSSVGRGEVWKSLGTTDCKEAKRLAPSAIAAIQKAWETAPPVEAIKPLARVVLTDDDLKRFAWEYYDAELNRDLEQRRRGLHKVHNDLMGQLQNAIPGKFRTEREEVIICLRDGQHCIPVAHWVDLICEREGIPRHQKNNLYRQVGQALLRARLEVLARVAERDQGRFDGVPTDPILASLPMAPIMVATVRSTSAKADDGALLRTRCEEYLLERRDVLSAEWLGALRATIELFLEYAGEDIRTKSVTKAHARGWRDALKKYPSRGKIRYPKLDFKAILAINAIDNHPPLSTASINKYITSLSTLFDWIVENEHDEVEKNPFDKLRIDGKRSGSKRDPFTAAQLRTIFHSPIFTGCKSTKQCDLPRPGSYMVSDWRFWLLPLALFTGARLGELAQMSIEDVKLGDGISFISINDDGEKNIKTPNSKRIIPIHPTLVSLGFLVYFRKIKAAGEVRLFPDIKPDSLGRLSSQPSKLFARYLTTIGVKTSARIVTHGFRHNFTDALREAGYDDRMMAPLLGHGTVGATVTAGYGTGSSLPIMTRHEMIKAIKYDVDLSHLLVEQTDGVQTASHNQEAV